VDYRPRQNLAQYFGQVVDGVQVGAPEHIGKQDKYR
jgi:hypothetical protein